jgi:hypothetical protein
MLTRFKPPYRVDKKGRWWRRPLNKIARLFNKESMWPLKLLPLPGPSLSEICARCPSILANLPAQLFKGQDPAQFFEGQDRESYTDDQDRESYTC